jgi:hypothetical protein
MSVLTSKRAQAPAGATLPQHRPPAEPVLQRQAFRVLQTSRAPAQLSLFLRPGGAR